MSWLDVLIVIPILVCLVRGYMHGFVSEVTTFAVVILGALGARLIAPSVSKVILSLFAWPEGVCDVVAYCLIFIGIAILLSLIAHAIEGLLNVIYLGWANRLVGAAFGACEAYLLIVIAVFVLERTNDEYHYLERSKFVNNSVLYPSFVDSANDLLYFSREQLGES